MKLLLMMVWCVRAVVAQQDSISLTADSPPPVRFFGGVATGQRGGTPISYWIVARYPIGTSAPRRAVVTNTVGSQNLTGSNFVRLSWAAMPEATGYDILRSTGTSDAYPASPSCAACAVVLNTSSLTVDDTGGALSAYPPMGVVTGPRVTADININNVSEAQPYFNVRMLNTNLRLGLVSSFTAGNCVSWLAGGRLGDAGAACGSGTGGTADNIVTPYSGTPTFTIPSGSLSTAFTITLTGNVTSSTLTGAVAGQRVHFRVCEDGVGNRTFAWPTTVIGFPDVYPLAGSCTSQSGIVNAAGNLIPDVQGIITDIGSYGQFRSCVAGLPPPPPPSGTILFYCKLSDLSFHALKSDGTDIAFGAGGSSASRDFVLDRSSFQYREDFLVTASSVASNLPPYPFTKVDLVNVSTFAAIAPEANHWGIARFSTGSSNGDDSYIFTRGANYNDAISRLDNVTGWGMRWIFRLNTVANVKLRIGLTDLDPFGSTVNNGVQLHFDTASDSTYQFETLIGGSSSKTDSGIAPNASNWMVLDIYSDTAGVVKFQLNGGAITSKAYTASAAVSMGVRLKTLANAAKTLDLDFVGLYAPQSR